MGDADVLLIFMTLASIETVLYSGRKKTLVGIAKYIFHRLIRGKVKSDIFFCFSENNCILIEMHFK